MTNGFRVNRIDRKSEVSIIVDGKRVSAFQGESLLAVLIVSGLKSFRKSSVLAEPRGGLCGMGVCYDCLVTVDGVPNIKACMTFVEDGMEVKTDE